MKRRSFFRWVAEEEPEVLDPLLRLREIRKHWQDGVASSSLSTPWHRRMAELVGDTDGLEEFEREKHEQAV